MWTCTGPQLAVCTTRVFIWGSFSITVFKVLFCCVSSAVCVAILVVSVSSLLSSKALRLFIRAKAVIHYIWRKLWVSKLAPKKTSFEQVFQNSVNFWGKSRVRSGFEVIFSFKSQTKRLKMFSKLFLIAFLVIDVKSVPFVTKRVSLHNPITWLTI